MFSIVAIFFGALCYMKIPCTSICMFLCPGYILLAALLAYIEISNDVIEVDIWFLFNIKSSFNNYFIHINKILYIFKTAKLNNIKIIINKSMKDKF